MRNHISELLAAAFPCFLAGCGYLPTATTASGTIAKTVKHQQCQRSHICDIVTLDKGRYSAEIFHDHESDEMAVYTFTPSCDEVAPIPASEIVITLANWPLKSAVAFHAAPQEKDPPGKSSKFVLCSSPSLCDALMARSANLQLASVPAADAETGIAAHASESH